MPNEELTSAANEQQSVDVQFDLFSVSDPYSREVRWSAADLERRDSERGARETPLIERSESRSKTESKGATVFATALEARRALQATVADVIKRLQLDHPSGGRPAISLVASAGIGKTETVCSEILSDAIKTAVPGQAPTVWFAVPNYRMVKQLVGTLRRAHNVSNRRIVILRGRDQNNMCRRSELIGRAGDLDIEFQKSFCDSGAQRCPYFATCKYQGMRRRAQQAEGRIIVMTHASLVRHPWLPKPDLVVIDEAIWSTLTHEVDFSLETFDRVAAAVAKADGMDSRAQKGAVRHLASLRSALIAPDGHTLRVLRDLKLSKASQLEWLAGIVAGPEDGGAGLTPDLEAEEFLKRLKDKLAPARKQVAAAIRQLAAEIEKTRDVPISVTLERDEVVQLIDRRRPEHQTRIHVFGQHQLQVPPSTPLLLLDASADPSIDRALWGDSIEHVYIRARRNGTFSQSTSRSGSQRSLVPTGQQSQETVDDAIRLQKLVASLVPGDGSGVLVIGSLRVVEALRTHLPPNTKHCHFNALRGVNAYKDFHTAIVVGREQPNCRALEGAARSIFFKDDKPLETAVQLEERKIRLLGCNVEIVSEFHRDPRAQAVLAQIREREIEQAMDRLRLINDDLTPKKVILISRVRTDAEISVAMNFPDLCTGGAPFSKAIDSSPVVRLSDADILKDIDVKWQSHWTGGAGIRMQYQRTARTAGLSDQAWLAIQCPGHRMFRYQIQEDGRVRSGRRLTALIRNDVVDPTAALQEKYEDQIVVNVAAYITPTSECDQSR